MGIIENPEIESIVKKLGIDSDLLEILSPKDIEDFVKMENNRKIINNSTKNYYKRKADCRNKNLDPKSA